MTNTPTPTPTPTPKTKLPTDKAEGTVHQMSPPQMASVFLVACVMAWVSMAGGIIAVGPALEGAWLPPLSDVKFERIERRGRSVCWSLHVRKNRGELTESQFFLDFGGGHRDRLLVTLGGQPLTLDAIIEPGVAITLDGYCAELPVSNGHALVDLSDRESTIRNIRYYRTHPLWVVIVALPPFTVPKESPKFFGPPPANDTSAPACTTCHRGAQSLR